VWRAFGVVAHGVVFSLDVAWPYLVFDDVQIIDIASVQEQASLGVTEGNTELDCTRANSHLNKNHWKILRQFAFPRDRIFQKQMDFRKVASRLVYAVCVKAVRIRLLVSLAIRFIALHMPQPHNAWSQGKRKTLFE
jgi:hypothetical protein